MLMLLVAAVLACDDDPAQDMNKIEGTWAAVSWEYKGVAKTPDSGLRVRYEIKGLDVTVRVGDDASFTMKITNFDPASKPHRSIDFTSGEGAKTQTAAGIYKLEGDTLTICTGGRPPG